MIATLIAITLTTQQVPQPGSVVPVVWKAGTAGYRKLPAAVDRDAYKEFWKAAKLGDSHGEEELIDGGLVVMVEPGTEVRVLSKAYIDVGTSGGTRRIYGRDLSTLDPVIAEAMLSAPVEVRIQSGDYEGEKLFVPTRNLIQPPQRKKRR